MSPALDIVYRFRLANGREIAIAEKIDTQTMESELDDADVRPAWSRLDFHQCPNCPLHAKTTPYCPLAERLVEPMEAFKDVASFDEVDLEVVTPERTIVKHTTAQRAASSLMGLVMATSGCPHMKFLKPMARLHLPLATEEETIFRVASSYLLAQYFSIKNALDTDFALENLKKLYGEIRTINVAMVARLRSVSTQDSAANAVILLDVFAKTLPYSVEDSLEDIRYLFVDL